jgi:hypothetical protein
LFIRSRRAPPHGPRRLLPFTDVDHPVALRLRDLAIADLLRWLGVDPPPPQIWPIAAHRPDPRDAVETFLRSLGIDVDAARRHDPVTLARLHDSVEALHAWTKTVESTDPASTQRLQLSILRADATEVARIARTLEVLSSITSRYAALTGPKPIKLYQEFVAEIRRYLTDPLAILEDECDDAKALAGTFETAASRYAALSPQLHGVMAELMARWRDLAPTADEKDLFSGLTRSVDEEERDLFERGRTAPLEIVESMTILLREANRLYDALCSRAAGADPGKGASGGDPGGAGSGGSSAGAGSGSGGATAADHIAEYCKVLGIDPKKPPPIAELKQLWRRFARDWHPDRHRTVAEKDIAKRRFQEGRDAYEQLSIHWKYSP